MDRSGRSPRAKALARLGPRGPSATRKGRVDLANSIYDLRLAKEKEREERKREIETT